MFAPLFFALSFVSSFLGQATPIPFGSVLTEVTGTSADIISWDQVLQIVLAGVVASMALWLLRRSVKLGR